MNILLPIAPHDALRPSPSSETSATPDGEGAGFAEALTAALLVPVTGEARPAPSQSDGSLIETAQQGRDPALLFGKNQPLDEAARSGALGPGLEAQAGPHDPSLHDGTAAPGTDRPLPLDPGSSPTDNADGAEVQTQTAKTEASPSGREEGKTPSVSTPDLATRAGDNGRALTDRPEARNHLPQDVVRAGLVDGQQAGQLPASGSDSLRNSGAGLTEFPRPDPASGRVNASAVATTALGLTGAEPVEALQRENSSALLLMAQQTRSTAATDPVTPARKVIGSEPALAPATAPSTSADPATAGGAPPLPVTHRDPARPENHSAIRPDQAGVAAGSGSPSDGLPTPVLPPSRPSAARPAAAANTDTPSANAFVSHGQHQTDANSPTSASSPRNQVERLQASPLATQTKPSTGTAADNALQAALSDVATQPDVEAGGSERIHSFLAAEGDPHRLERLDLNATGAASARLPGAASQPPASGQIALQIQRFASDGVDRFSLQLHPAELGSVDIELSFEGAGRISAVITAERPETLELLQRDSRLLERSLGDSGLKLTSDGLSFALKQDQQQQQPGQNFQQQAEARENASRAGRAYDDAADNEQAPSIRRIDGLRLLDIET